MKTIFTFLVLLASQGVWAQDANQVHALMTPQEQEIQARAKKKLYPGGRDQDPLKVQSQMTQPTRKMGPAESAPEDAVDEATD